MTNSNPLFWPVSAEDGISPCGGVKIESFAVSEEEANYFNIRAKGNASIYPGSYKRLIIDNDVVMSNTPMEVRTNMRAFHSASGRILINGLGLGMLVEKMLTKPDVEHITIVEMNPEVIALVGPVFENNDRVTIIEEDAFSYQPPKGEKFHFVWHDIWTFICSYNLTEMKRLHRKYGRRANAQLSWARAECERARY